MRTRIWLLPAALMGLVGCSGSSDRAAQAANSEPNAAVAESNVARVPAEQVLDADLDAVARANNAFAVDLYAQLRGSKPTGNLLTCPISASLALTMTLAGAREQTESEMAAVLHLDTPSSSAFAGQNALSQALNARAAAALTRAQKAATETGSPAPSEADYQLELVNSIWGQTAFPWEPPFLDTLAADYGTGLRQLDFAHAPEPARVTINQWVSDNTNDKINELLPSGVVDSDTRLVLVDALHLKLPWAEAFSPALTARRDFVRADASTASVDFMNRDSSLSYVDDGRAQIVALPLSGGDLSVVITLPHEGVSLADYEGSLTSDSAALREPPTETEVELSLPKAAFTSDTFSLVNALEALGMKQAFDGQMANFKGLCANPPDGQNLYISQVLQKTMIAMQETGVEAAAATAVLLTVGSAAPEKAPTPVSMVVNRPYLVTIVDTTTHAVLMLGHIQDPTDAGAP